MIHSIYFVSLGCAKNIVDSSVAIASILKAGFCMTEDLECADICWINTCAFLEIARLEVAEHLKVLALWKKNAPNRKIVISGCLTQWDAKHEFQFKKKYKQVDLWLDIDSFENTGEAIQQLYHKKNSVSAPHLDILEPTWIYNAKTPRVLLEEGAFAYLKIADGCDNMCHFCLIPSIRGHLRSRAVKDIVEEAKNILALGKKELILIAQDTGAFGRDINGKSNLPELLKELDKLNGNFFIRLMYLHPRSVSKDLIQVMRHCKHLIPHLEMPIQHVTDTMLEAMNRHITAKEQEKVVSDLKKAGFTLRTTLMTGYPGETEQDFNALKELVRSKLFERIGVFAFSPEEGTEAAKFSKKISAKVAQMRAESLLMIQKEIFKETNKQMLGKQFTILIDRVLSKKRAIGRLLQDAPDVDLLVHVRELSANIQSGDIVQVEITRVTSFDLYGKYLIDSSSKE